jgi:hypothetical protein
LAIQLQQVNEILKTELQTVIVVPVSRDKAFLSFVEFKLVVYFKTPSDVDLGYVSNDRSEFEDSDVAGLNRN